MLRTKLQKLSSLGVNILLILSSISFTLLVAELVLTYLGKKNPYPRTYVGEHENYPSANFIPDQNVGWRMRPSHSFQWVIDGKKDIYIADEQGFRTDFNRRVVKNPLKCIVIVGDSFMWGTGVSYQETVGYQLERLNKGYIVHNLAMPGFGVDQIWLSLRYWGLHLKPDLVIIGLFDDDFNRSFFAYRQGEGFNKPTYKLERKILIEMTSKDRPNWLLGFLERNSRLFTIWRQFDKQLGFNYRTGEWWLLNEAILDKMLADAAKTKTQMLFVHIPNKTGQAFPSLKDYMKEHQVNFIALSNLSVKQREEFYLKEDIHLNAKGHKYLATIISQWIRSSTSH
jgi:hypothetical protein